MSEEQESEMMPGLDDLRKPNLKSYTKKTTADQVHKYLSKLKTFSLWIFIKFSGLLVCKATVYYEH